jgi:predicted nucleic acid-binding protein
MALCLIHMAMVSLIRKSNVMSGSSYLADTNAFIYFLEKREAILPLIETPWAYSFITKIELLGKPGISTSEIETVKQVLYTCTALGIQMPSMTWP